MSTLVISRRGRIPNLTNFHEYLDKETLNIYVFDSSNPIQVDTEGKEVQMVKDENDITDLIGICRIKLRELILNNKIQGKFAILNESGTNNMGYLIVTIKAEEIVIDKDNKFSSKKFEDNISGEKDAKIVKLAAVIKDKGLNMNSAFRIFDKENENQITIENFKSIVLFTFKSVKDENELNKLVKVVFRNKVVLDKQDFYQLFNGLLEFDDNSGAKTQININNEQKIDNQNLNKTDLNK